MPDDTSDLPVGLAHRDRYLTLINANDRRYEQRFEAQQEALRTALAIREVQVAAMIAAVKEHTLSTVHSVEKAQDVQAANAALALVNARESAIQLVKAEKEGVLTLIVALTARMEQRFSSLEHTKEIMFRDQDRAIATAHTADKEFLMARFDSLKAEGALAIASVKESIALALSAAEKAVAKAEVSAEKRFDGVNEFRAQLSDQQRTLIPRSEVDVIISGLHDKIKTLENRLGDDSIRISNLSTATTSKSEGQHQGWGWAVGGIGLVAAVLSIIFAVMGKVSH